MGWNLAPRRRRQKTPMFRVNEKELESIMHHFHKSTLTKLGAYLREKALGHTVHIKYRNESLDNYLTEMIPLKNALIQLAAAIDRAGGVYQADEKATLHEKIDQVLEKLVEIYKQCSSL